MYPFVLAWYYQVHVLLATPGSALGSYELPVCTAVVLDSSASNPLDLNLDGLLRLYKSSNKSSKYL